MPPALELTPFNHQFFSDHPGIFVDLKLEGLFDRNLPPLARPTYRDIRSDSTRLIWTYITELKRYLIEHKIKERLDKLAESRDGVLAAELDQAITNGMLLAGAKCETAKRLPKSGKLHEAQTVMRIYQNVLSQLRTKRDLSQQIEKRQVQIPVTISIPTSVTEANRLLRISQRLVCKLSCKAYDLKEQQQEEQVEALINAGPGSTKEEILQRVECFCSCPLSSQSHPEEYL
jgi:hypothetical protein